MEPDTKPYRYLSKSGLIEFIYLLKSFLLNHSIRIKALEDEITWLKKHAITDSNLSENDQGGDG